MANDQNQATEKNFVGSSYPSDYKGTPNGFVTYFSKTDLHEMEKFMNAEGRVAVHVRPAKDPSKAFATMFTPKVREQQQDQGTQQGGNASAEAEDGDLPF